MQGFTTGHLNILWVVLTNKFSDSSQKENKWVPLGKTWDYYRNNMDNTSAPPISK